MKKLLIILSLVVLASTQAHAVTIEKAGSGYTYWFTADEFWDFKAESWSYLDDIIQVGTTGAQITSDRHIQRYFPDLIDIMDIRNHDGSSSVVVEIEDELGNRVVKSRGPNYRWGFSVIKSI